MVCLPPLDATRPMTNRKVVTVIALSLLLTQARLTRSDEQSIAHVSRVTGRSADVESGVRSGWEAPRSTLLAKQSQKGELLIRLKANFDRLEQVKYQPDNVFLTNLESNYWPGDTEGRAVLALTLLTQASHREARHLEEILRRFPGKLNARGYFGDIAPKDVVDEQQLSSHGWVLRALCEHYEWSRSEAAAAMIRGMITNLVLPTSSAHQRYPIDPDQRQHGGSYSGSRRNKVLDGWVLSTDIGCDFIFMDGVVHAYALFPSPGLKAVVDEMIARFLEIDLLAIKAQTHATLTALRGLLRYHAITGDPVLLHEARVRFALYKSHGMTENYENLNWFGRPTHSEPCAIVDSFLVAAQLWQATGDPVYLEDAHHIYFNGIASTQRPNGGFGCNACLGAADGVLKEKIYEAHWCCTMRGAEGLARAAQYGSFTRGNELFVTMYGDNTVSYALPAGDLVLEQTSEYPTGPVSRFRVVGSDVESPIPIGFFVPDFMRFDALTLNGRPLSVEHQRGFVSIDLELRTEDEIELRLAPVARWQPTLNATFGSGRRTLRYGPLLLGFPDAAPEQVPAIDLASVKHLGGREFSAGSVKLRSVYRLLEPNVKNEAEPLLVVVPAAGEVE